MTRHYLTLAKYTNEKTRSQAGGAATSLFLEQVHIVGLRKKPDELLVIEKKIQEIRQEFLPILDKHLSSKQARLEIAVCVVGCWLLVLVLVCVCGGVCGGVWWCGGGGGVRVRVDCHRVLGPGPGSEASMHFHERSTPP